jgi:membrane fusion protein, multidrug efflux system
MTAGPTPMAHGLVAAMLAMALACVSACSQSEAPAPAVVAPPAGEVLVVAPQVVPDYKAVSAILTNRDIGDARARIGGKISRIVVKEGDKVRAGQVVAVVSDERIFLESRAAAAGVAAAQAAAEKARLDLQRAERLLSSGAISQAAIETARTNAQSADAGLRAVRAQAQAAEAMNAQGQVTSPAAGAVIRIPSPEGAVVMAGEVVVAISTGARVLRIELPEGESAFLKQGSEVSLLVGGDGDVPRSARIRQVYPSVTAGRVMADLDAAGFETELVGARVRVLAPAGQRETIVIPARYVSTRFGADYVRLRRSSGAVIEAPVQRGSPIPTAEMPDGVEILSGLRQGDAILPASGPPASGSPVSGSSGGETPQ